MNYYEKRAKGVEVVQRNYEILKNGELPKSFYGFLLPLYSGDPFDDENYVNMRSKYISDFGFPLFAEDWVKPLAKWIGSRKCLEIMAGKGQLSYFLRKYGVKIKATDNFTWPEPTWFKDNHLSVEKLDCIEAIRKYGKQVEFILCSWPYMDSTAYNSLIEMRKVNPKCRMIYIGEGYGGCTANNAFFDEINECNLKTFNRAVYRYSSWEGIHDSILLVS